MGSAVARVVRGGFWLYASSVVSNVGGFIYWLLISWIAGSAILGLTSVTVGFAALINGVISLGIGMGLRHFLGHCLGEGDIGCFRRYLWTGLTFSLITYSTASAALAIAGAVGLGVAGLTPDMVRMASILVLLDGVSTITQSGVVSTLRTEVVMVATLAGNVAKLVVGVLLVKAGLGFVGAVVGFALLPVSLVVVGAAYLLRFAGMPVAPSTEVLKELLRGSVVSWLPAVIVLAGQWVGVLAVFGSVGEVGTGRYYVAFAISNFVLGVAVMMIWLLLPVLSGMRDGRKTAASRVLRLSLAIMVPAAAFVATYPSLPLSLLGSEYVDASATLTVLLMSSVPLAVYSVVNSLVYSYRRYLDVLYLGLSQNVPRLLLYLLLVPRLGGFGAAVSFTAGAFTGLVHAAILARDTGFGVGWVDIGKAVAIPTSFMAVAYLLSLPWFLGVGLAVVTYLLYARVGVLRKEDVRDLAYALLGKGLTTRVYERARWFIDHVFG